MLCPAAVSAAAAAVWLLAVLGPGLSLPAEDNSESDFTLCSHCFYRQKPPRGASAGPLLRPLCHRLPGGQAFATLSRPTCDTAVYSAFHLSHGWTAMEGEEGEEFVIEEEDNIKVAVPALLRGVGDPSHPVSTTDSPLQHWESRVTTLVVSSVIPQCSTLGGDLYILTGAGGLRPAEDCQTKPLWSAVCCTGPEGKGGFSIGLIRETEEWERQLSVKELEEILGVAELFSEGCGGAEQKTLDIRAGLPGNIEEMGADADGAETGDAEGQDAGEHFEEGREATQEQVAGVAKAQVANVAQETSADAASAEDSSDKLHDVAHSGADRSQSPRSSSGYESAEKSETDTNSTSTLVYIICTTLSILKAPLLPVFSTVTQLPGQVTYVLQEDLGVLSALPGDTLTVFHLLISDLLSGIGSAAEMLLGIGETCFLGIYYCTSSISGALLSSCYTGVTGMGTLAGDTVGIFSDALDNAWWVTKFFGEWLWDHSEGYVGTVMSEVGGQAQAVGKGFGSLAWRSGNGVGNVFRLGGGLIMGVVDMATGAVKEAFGSETEE
ncbi:uncharacterized protein LOC125015761 [Mugil cephalus]|uniref:uncharacterized protein LOC125015761 n=1 Tax=Mugil cephalus TaxID=48193 RepID=UPI001FB77C12|nr:uncharacterized protein LOC125015761 [Mugil cephalus]